MNSGQWPVLCAAIHLSLFKDYKENEMLTTGLKVPSLWLSSDNPGRVTSLPKAEAIFRESGSRRTNGRPQRKISDSKLGVRIKE